MNTIALSKDFVIGDIIWIKYKSQWWPGQLIKFEDLPIHIQKSEKKNKHFAVAKYFQENNYSIIKNEKQILKYENPKKEDIIMKMLFDLRNNKNKSLFEESIRIVEKLTDGDVNILLQEKFDVKNLSSNKKSRKNSNKENQANNEITTSVAKSNDSEKMESKIAMNHTTEHSEPKENKNTKQVLVPSSTQVSDGREPKNEEALDNNSYEITLNNLSSRQVSNGREPKKEEALNNNSYEITLNNLSSFEKKLIFEVQARELLWNTNLPLELRSEKIVNSQWEKIKNILEDKTQDKYTVEELKAAWERLRFSYVKYIRSLSQTPNDCKKNEALKFFWTLGNMKQIVLIDDSYTENV